MDDQTAILLAIAFALGLPLLGLAIWAAFFKKPAPAPAQTAPQSAAQTAPPQQQSTMFGRVVLSGDPGFDVMNLIQQNAMSLAGNDMIRATAGEMGRNMGAAMARGLDRQLGSQQAAPAPGQPPPNG